jgi:hypothetical protein
MLEYNPIVTAPANVEPELNVFEKGEYHALVFACRRDGFGWLDVVANRHFVFEPAHWRPWENEQH